MWIETFNINDLTDKQRKRFIYNNHNIIIYRDGDKIYAFENKCSHEDFPLFDGYIDGKVIECSKHGAKFDIETGEVLSMPAVIPIKVYKIKIENKVIYV
ncbi:MAG: non-heme iron oxygenase ferredoxin subunit, partial [Planctomycetota bacterium]